jgi:membrane-associated phospholipid phosphatase
MVLDAHWPLDVVAGFALGATGSAAAAWWDASHPADPPPASTASADVERGDPRRP